MEFFEKYKKPLLITGFLLVVIILGYFIYALFFKPTLTPSSPVTPGSGAGSGLPVAQTGQGQIVDGGEARPLTGQPGSGGTAAGYRPNDVARGGLTETTAITSLPTAGATLSADGKELEFYNRNDGKFYRMDENGEATPLTDKIFHQVQNIVWSPGKNEAILEYPDGSNIVYNFATNKQITLPSHWTDFSYSPDGKEIVMKSLGQDPSNRWLAVVSSDGSQVRGIESLGDKDDTVYPAWSPNNQMVAMFTEGVDFNRQEVYFVGLNKENFKSTIVEGRGFNPKWAPDGARLLYSVYSSDSGMKPDLWVVDANGDDIGNNRKKLNLQTWADKCSFTDAATLYCAVPKTLEEGAGLFPELAQATADQLYQIDLTTGAKKLLAVPTGDYTIENVNISADGRNLYFTDKNSGSLYKIKLK